MICGRAHLHHHARRFDPSEVGRLSEPCLDRFADTTKTYMMDITMCACDVVKPSMLTTISQSVAEQEAPSPGDVSQDFLVIVCLL